MAPRWTPFGGRMWHSTINHSLIFVEKAGNQQATLFSIRVLKLGAVNFFILTERS